MELTETKPNIYKYTIDNVNFVFRIWEDEILAFHSEAKHNVSFKYGSDPQYRYDSLLTDEWKQDKETFDFWLESISKMLARIYNRKHANR